MADETIPLSSVKKKYSRKEKRRRRIPRAPVARTLKSKTFIFLKLKKKNNLFQF
jgi:hypothetical protein